MVTKRKQIVLVSVINRRKDLDLLLFEKWYRIPVAKMPARAFDWLAFYQTSALGKEGKVIRYYARVDKISRVLRKDLLPDEKEHPRYLEEYFRLDFTDVKEMPRPIRNNSRMRFTFGFTTLPRMMRFRSLHTLFGIRPLEMIFRRILKRRRVPFFSEYPIRSRGRVRYRLDLAVFCKSGKVDIECDMPKYHSGKRRMYDDRRNRFLRRRGWVVRRFSDADILFNSDRCIRVIDETIVRLGGF